MCMDLIENAVTKLTGYVKQETVKSDRKALENDNFLVYKSFGDLKVQSWTRILHATLECLSVDMDYQHVTYLSTCDSLPRTNNSREAFTKQYKTQLQIYTLVFRNGYLSFSF